MSTPAHDEDKVIYQTPYDWSRPAAFSSPKSAREHWDEHTLSRLPSQAKEREEYPIQTGCIDYFPDAIAEIAKLSYDATAQHHPNEPMHWQRDKSTAHADKIQRHQLERFDKDTDGHYHATKVAWRALAQLQEFLEKTRGLKASPASRGKRTWDT